MEKFTKLRPTSEYGKKEPLFSNDFIDIVEYDGWTIIQESDFVVCVIYLIELNQLIFRHEYIPTFKYVDGQDYHITVLSGAIEKGESKEVALLREIEEEAGIIVDPDFKIEFMKPLFISKSHASKYHPAILTLSEKDYDEVMAKGDGSKAEKLSKSIKIDAKYINSLMTSDLITEFMIIKIKDHLNLK